MNDRQMIREYEQEIVDMGGVPRGKKSPTPMRIAKLDDQWRKLKRKQEAAK